MSVSTTGGGLYFDSEIDGSKFQASIRNMNNDINKFTNNVTHQGAEIENFAKRAAAAATAFLSLQAAEGFIEKMVKIRGEFQQIEVAFTTMLKSKEASNRLMGQMVQLAATTPFTLSEVAKSGKQLLAYGFAADTITETLTKLGDIAAGVSAPIGDIAYLFGTLKTQGRAFTKDIREFSGRGIPIVAELAKVLKTSEANVNAMVEAGKVGFPEVEKAFNNLTSSGGMFFNLMKEQSKTLTGRLSNLEDAWDNMLNSLGKSNEGIFASGIQAAADLVANYENVLSILTVLAAGYGTYRAALIATAAFERVAAASNVGLALSLNQESVARITNAASMLDEMRANVSNLAVKKAAAEQTLSSDLALLSSAKQRLAAAELAQASSGMDVLSSTRLSKAKEVQAAAEDVLAAKDRASLSRKAQVAAVTEFSTAKTELETTAKIANSEATVELTAVEAIQTANKRILTAVTEAYNAVLAATPAAAFAVAITSLGVAIYALSKTTTAATASQKALNDIQTEVSGNYAEQALTIKDYIKIIKDANSTETERNTALKKLNELNPALLGALNAQNVSTKEGSEAIKEYLKWLDAKLAGEAAYVVKSDAVKRIAERNIRANTGDANTKGLDWSTRLGYSLKNFFTGKSSISGEQESTNIVNELNKQDQAIIDAVDKKYGAALRQRALDGVTPDDKSLPTIKNKAYYEAIVKKNTDDLEALDSGEKDFQAKAAPLIANIKAARAKLLQFDVSDKQQNKEDSTIKRHSEMLKKIYDLNDKYNNKSLTDDQQKLADIRSEYKSLQKDIEIYNANPKNKKVNPNLKPNLEKALTNQQYENDTKKLGIELDKQKDLYAQFEEYRTELGDTAAKERFEKSINVDRTLVEELEAQRAELLKKDPLDMSGPERDRLTDLDTRINDAVKAQNAVYTGLLAANNSYEQQKAVLTDRYNAAFLLLQGDANKDRRLVLTKGYQDELDALTDSNFAKTAAGKKFAEGALVLTRTEVKNQIAALKSAYSGEELPQAIQQQITKLQNRFKLGADQANLDEYKEQEKALISKMNAEADKSTPKFAALNAELVELKKNMKGLDSDGDGVANTGIGKFLASLDPDGGGNKLKGAAEALADVSDALGVLSQGLQDTNASAAYTLDSLSQLSGAASNLAFSLFSHDPQKIIQAGIHAVGTLFSLAKKNREANAAARLEVADFYAAAIKGEREYQALLLQRQIDTAKNNKNAIDGVLAEYKLRQQQLSAYGKEYNEIIAKLQGMSSIASEEYIHGTWFRKAQVKKTYESLAGKSFDELSTLLSQGKLEGDAKSLVERLKELEQNGYDAEQALKDLADQTNELFTGTTSDSLTDSLLEMFKKGETGAADLASFFKTTMDDAALSIFKNTILKDAMDKFYAEFAAKAKDGTVTEQDRADLITLFNSLTDDAKEQFELLKQITGSDLGTGSTDTATGVSGAIVGEALKEDTANRLLGIEISQFDEIKRQGIVAQSYFKIAASNLSSIAANTLRTADNTEILKPMAADIKKMVGNLDSSSSTDLYQALRDGGVKG